jgi:hypothetical protein
VVRCICVVVGDICDVVRWLCVVDKCICVQMYKECMASRSNLRDGICGTCESCGWDR